MHSKLKQFFTEDEVNYLLRKLSEKLFAGIGPIESGVPQGGHYKASSIEFLTARVRLTEMDIGDSCTIDNKLRLRPFVRCASKNGFKIAFKRLPLGEYRLWKLADPPKSRAPKKKTVLKMKNLKNK